jgi:hypothetical protein
VQAEDWYALGITIIFCGVGLIVATFTKNTTRWFGVSLIVLGLVCLSGWGYYRATAQTPPSVNGDCSAGSVGGNFSPNCPKTYISPPHRPNVLYDGDSELGFVDGDPVISDDKKYILLRKISVYDGFPWGKVISFQSQTGSYSINCPEKQDCPPNSVCRDGQTNFSGQMMNFRSPVICNLVAP